MRLATGDEPKRSPLAHMGEQQRCELYHYFLQSNRKSLLYPSQCPLCPLMWVLHSHTNRFKHEASSRFSSSLGLEQSILGSPHLKKNVSKNFRSTVGHDAAGHLQVWDELDEILISLVQAANIYIMQIISWCTITQ